MRKITGRVLTALAAAVCALLLASWLADAFLPYGDGDRNLALAIIAAAIAAWAGWTGRLGRWLRALFRPVD